MDTDRHQTLAQPLGVQSPPLSLAPVAAAIRVLFLGLSSILADDVVVFTASSSRSSL
ncbi:hypothetical protein Dimus_021198, partial [Dionaea muscipula]